METIPFEYCLSSWDVNFFKNFLEIFCPLKKRGVGAFIGRGGVYGAEDLVP